MVGVVDGAGPVREGECLVVMGGTNDPSVEGVRAGLNDLKKRIGNSKNVIVVGVPKRFDEDKHYPHIAELVQPKNDLIKQFCNFHNLKYLNIDNSRREHFTRHGLHFNRHIGKKWLAEQIKTAVKHFLG